MDTGSVINFPGRYEVNSSDPVHEANKAMFAAAERCVGEGRAVELIEICHDLDPRSTQNIFFSAKYLTSRGHKFDAMRSVLSHQAERYRNNLRRYQNDI